MILVMMMVMMMMMMMVVVMITEEVNQVTANISEAADNVTQTGTDSMTSSIDAESPGNETVATTLLPNLTITTPAAHASGTIISFTTASPVDTVRPAEASTSTAADGQHTTFNPWLETKGPEDDAGEYLMTSPGKYHTDSPMSIGIARCYIYIFIHQNSSRQKENTNIQTKSSIKNTFTEHYNIDKLY